MRLVDFLKYAAVVVVTTAIVWSTSKDYTAATLKISYIGNDAVMVYINDTWYQYHITREVE